jgi:hypothetical protein
MKGANAVKIVRAVSSVVTLVAAVLLGLVVAESGGSVSQHKVYSTHVVHTRVQEALPPAAATPTTSPIVGVPAPASASTGSAAVSKVVTSASVTTPTTPTTTPAPPPASTTPTTTSPPLAANALPACPVGLSAPADSGGLQSLIGFAPLFGPFSAEAFASAAAFQPVLELIGPFLVAFANAYAPSAPELAPLLAQVESLENAGYAVLGPLYGPYRTQLLTAETQLATELSPLADTLVDNPLSSCVVDVEGVLSGSH